MVQRVAQEGDVFDILNRRPATFTGLYIQREGGIGAGTEKDFAQFQQGTRELLRNFLEFFVSYGLELGEQPKDKTFEELSQKLQTLGRSGNQAKNL